MNEMKGIKKRDMKTHICGIYIIINLHLCHFIFVPNEKKNSQIITFLFLYIYLSEYCINILVWSGLVWSGVQYA